MKMPESWKWGARTAVYLVTATAPVLAENLLTNGSFEAGTNGFTTEYSYAPAGNSNEGEFTVRSDPQNWNLEFAATPDHTFGAGGTGMVLVVNGATSGTKAVWEETVAVTPFTAYQFQAWVSTAVPGGPADLLVEINGVAVGSNTTAPAQTGTWLPFSRSWNSESASHATLRIIDTDVSRFPNDFYLDDISFDVEPSAPYLRITMQAGVPRLEIYSRTGRTNRLEYSSDVSGLTNWSALTSLWSESSPVLILDRSATNSLQRLYRAVQVP